MVAGLLAGLLSVAPPPFWGVERVVDTQGIPVISCSLNARGRLVTWLILSHVYGSSPKVAGGHDE